MDTQHIIYLLAEIFILAICTGFFGYLFIGEAVARRRHNRQHPKH